METTLKRFYDDYSAQGCIVSMFVPIMQVLDIVNQEKKRKFMQGEKEIFKELCENIPTFVQNDL